MRHATLRWPFRQYDPWTERLAPRSFYVGTHVELHSAAAGASGGAPRHPPSYDEAMRGLHGRDIWRSAGLPSMLSLLGITETTTASPSAAPHFIAQIVRQTRPRLIIEVGSFHGATAIEFARALDEVHGSDRTPLVIAIDTWLGDSYMWGQKRSRRCADCSQTYFELLRSRDGLPLFYYQFLKNVLGAKASHRIVPFPLASNEAARVLDYKGWLPDLVYVDAAHDAVDVLMDLEHYWHLLQCGGTLFGDDYHWPSVRSAVDSFAARRNLTLELAEIHVAAERGLETATPRRPGERFTSKNSKWVIRAQKACTPVS